MNPTRYHLRPATVTGVQDMYVTAHGKNMPVEIVAHSKEHKDNQTWAMVSGGTEGDKCRMCLYDPASKYALGLGVPGKLVPGEPMIMTDEKHQVVWNLHPCKVAGVDKAYTLCPDMEVTDAHWYAGVNKDGKVVIKALSVDCPKDQIPYWVLERAN